MLTMSLMSLPYAQTSFQIWGQGASPLPGFSLVMLFPLNPTHFFPLIFHHANLISPDNKKKNKQTRQLHLLPSPCVFVSCAQVLTSGSWHEVTSITQQTFQRRSLLQAVPTLKYPKAFVKMTPNNDMVGMFVGWKDRHPLRGIEDRLTPSEHPDAPPRSPQPPCLQAAQTDSLTVPES